jgi:hypothetical protein
MERFITMSIPKNEDEGAFWFVYDTKLRRSVAEVDSYDAAVAKVRELRQKGTR